MARRGEFDDLVLRLARLSSEVLSEWIEGELKDTFPALYPAIKVAKFEREPAP